MSLSDLEIIELYELLDRLVERNLSHDQKRRLEDWLSKSAEARRIYVSFVDMSVSLSSYADESLSVKEEPENPSQIVKFISFVQPWLPMAAVLVVGIYLYSNLSLSSFTGNDTKGAVVQKISSVSDYQSVYQPDLTSPVAVLTKSVGLQWSSHTNNRPELGSALEPGVFEIKSGMAQLEFMQGATAILEGPADAKLINANAVSIRSGKLRAHVPKVAIGFSVDLPMGQVVDLGTDFGVEVHPEGSAEVFVYRGKVQYKGVDFEGNEVLNELSGGEAIYLDSFGISTPLDMPSGNFLGTADLAFRSLENAHKRRSAWMKKSKELAADPNTLLYYGFDGHDSWSRVVRDETNRASGAGDGAVIGCNWTEGRWPGKGALEFAQDNDRVCLNLNKSLKQATLVAWVRLNGLGVDGAPLVFSRPHLDGAIGWSVNPSGKLVLEVKTSNLIETYESAVAFPPDRLGKWVHLATSFDAEKKWVNHFINGRSFSRERINRANSISLKKGLLGHFQAFPDRNPKLSLRGSIDEFAIFSSVWDEGTIRELFEVGRPQGFKTEPHLP